jgi:hypothetical protein
MEVHFKVLPGKFSTHHIAFPMLSKGTQIEKSNYFNDFKEYLRVLNLEGLKRVFVEVEN